MSIQPKRALGWLVAIAAAFGLAQTFAPAQGITIPNTFVNETIADASQVNANFAALAANALNRNGGTLGGTLNLNGQTLSGTATASGAWAFSSTVSITGATTVGDLRGTTETITATGTVNDQAIAVTTTILRLNNASLLTLTGFTGGAAGRLLIVESVGTGTVVLSNQTGSSAADQLLNFATSGGTPLAAGSGMAMYVYDGTTLRWRLVRHEQGAWITPSFTAGDFTGNNAMTWTVGSGDVAVMKYRLSGRTIQMTFNLATTTVAGTPSTALQIGNGQWGGFTVTSVSQGHGRISDNGGAATTGYWQTAAGGTGIPVFRDLTTSANWTAATDTTALNASVAFEVN